MKEESQAMETDDEEKVVVENEEAGDMGDEGGDSFFKDKPFLSCSS